MLPKNEDELIVWLLNPVRSSRSEIHSWLENDAARFADKITVDPFSPMDATIVFRILLCGHKVGTVERSGVNSLQIQCMLLGNHDQLTWTNATNRK